MLLLGAGYYCYGNISLCSCLVPVINVTVALVCLGAWCWLFCYGNISLSCCLVPVINVTVTLVCVVARYQLLTVL